MRRRWRLYLLAVSFALGASSNPLAEDQTFTTIDFPGATLTRADGITPRGDIVGAQVSGGVRHGYLLSGGEFTAFDFPGAIFANANAINPRGDIVGRYIIGNAEHGFVLPR